jgi:hypothetical protein
VVDAQLMQDGRVNVVNSREVISVHLPAAQPVFAASLRR